MIRPATERDRALIYDSWMESFVNAQGAGPYGMPQTFTALRATIDDILALPSVRIEVYDGLDDGDSVLGWAVTLPPGRHDHKNPDTKQVSICGAPCLAYVFTKRGARGEGVATSLLKSAGVEPTSAFCYAFNTAIMHRLVNRDRAWPGGRWDSHIFRHLRRGEAQCTGR